MSNLVDWLAAEWSVVTQAPFAFASGLAAAFGAGWLVAKALLGERLATLSERVTSRDEKILRLNEQLDQLQELRESPAQPAQENQKALPAFSSHWRKVARFTYWQAAWLWVGVEPTPRVLPGTSAYPVLQMLKQSAMDGELPHQLHGEYESVNVWTTSTRDDLRALAAKKGEAPAFLAE